MHKQWESEEDISHRLIDLVLHGRDEDIVEHVNNLPSRYRRSAITHIGRDGNSALHLAALRERLASLAVMLGCQVDVGMRNGNGESPLYVCLSHNALKSAKMLLNNGADVNEIVARRINETLLHKMVKGDRRQAVDMLLDAGTLIDAKTKDGDTSLHFAARYNRPIMARRLIQCGADLNLSNKKQETCLHVAIANKSVDVAKILIKAKANLASTDKQGMTPLHQAVASGVTELAKMMLTANSSHVNSKEQLMGRTPLLFACASTDHKLAPLLLSHGADANLTTNYRKSVLHLAASVGNTHALNAVIKHASNLNALSINNKTPLHCAVLAGQLEAVRTLLRAGVNPNLKDIEGDTALHMAASAGDGRTAAQLLQQPNIQVNLTNMCQRTALHHAMMAGHEETGEILIAAGCNPTMLDVYEKSAHEYLHDFYTKLKQQRSGDRSGTNEVHFSAEGEKVLDKDIQIGNTEPLNDELVNTDETTNDSNLKEDAIVNSIGGLTSIGKEDELGYIIEADDDGNESTRVEKGVERDDSFCNQENDGEYAEHVEDDPHDTNHDHKRRVHHKHKTRHRKSNKSHGHKGGEDGGHASSSDHHRKHIGSHHIGSVLGMASRGPRKQSDESGDIEDSSAQIAQQPEHNTADQHKKHHLKNVSPGRVTAKESTKEHREHHSSGHHKKHGRHRKVSDHKKESLVTNIHSIEHTESAKHNGALEAVGSANRTRKVGVVNIQ